MGYEEVYELVLQHQNLIETKTPSSLEPCVTLMDTVLLVHPKEGKNIQNGI